MSLLPDARKKPGFFSRLARLARGARIASARAGITESRIPSDYEIVAPVYRTPAPDLAGVAADQLYLDFENVFYDPEVVKRGHRLYAELVSSEAPLIDGRRPTIDLGAGRGELLEQLIELGVDAEGIELNSLEARMAQDRGLPVTHNDAVSYLSGLEDGCLSAATLIQVVEHLQTDYFLSLVGLLSRKLVSGGIAIIETVNSKCIPVHGTFWVDITHVRMYPAETVWFYLAAAGFSHARIVYRVPVPPSYRIADDPTASYANFAIVAYR